MKIDTKRIEDIINICVERVKNDNLRGIAEDLYECIYGHKYSDMARRLDFKACIRVGELSRDVENFILNLKDRMCFAADGINFEKNTTVEQLLHLFTLLAEIHLLTSYGRGE